MTQTTLFNTSWRRQSPFGELPRIFHQNRSLPKLVANEFWFIDSLTNKLEPWKLTKKVKRRLTNLWSKSSFLLHWEKTQLLMVSATFNRIPRWRRWMTWYRIIKPHPNSRKNSNNLLLINQNFYQEKGENNQPGYMLCLSLISSQIYLHMRILWILFWLETYSWVPKPKA